MRRLSPFSKFLIVISVISLVLFLILSRGKGLTQSEDTKRILISQNYKNIEILGYGFGKCGKDDIYATSFRATAPNGQTVTGCVCSGILKGHTVRFD